MTDMVEIIRGNIQADMSNRNGLAVENYSDLQKYAGNKYAAQKTETIASGGTNKYLLRTPNSSKRFLFNSNITAEQGITAKVIENATITGSGTAITLYNLNRNSSNTCTMSRVAYGATSSGGTELPFSAIAGDIASAPRATAIDFPVEPIELDNNQDYIVEITNRDAAETNDVKAIFMFIEDTPES